ncbi:MAG: hypothetical protein DRR16_00970 [Candidatus Parabeggiatoa sp. nov. 3]|nr:MAG: hypothetical protein DRR00_11095 [Gammaproteobacteria bacterium]RKZ67264.1 MAG: hypothetical protein DRQ99_07180 [Gammaproteobacteria bacterium]RKZ89981.1 MAG: hypothetical protein DRR16_00970 [Gammaproteobacteria bacterium]
METGCAVFFGANLTGFKNLSGFNKGEQYMRKHFLKILIITLSLLLNSTLASAFDLFNPDRGKPPPPPPKPTTSTFKKPTKPKTKLINPFKARVSKKTSRQKHKPKKLPPQKDFVLQGTSRFGSRRAAVLKGPNNKSFIQYFENNTRTPLKGFEEYYLVSVQAREVQIEYPADFPCHKDKPKKGLRCDKIANGKTVAILNLKRNEALPPPKASPKKTAKKSKVDEQKKRKELYKNFKKRVIKDEDVPAGMRVVRTPFGDRLVPLK